MSAAEASESRLARVGLALAAWSERWFPDPAMIAFLGVVVVFVLGVLAGEEPGRLAFEGGKSFLLCWLFSLAIPFVPPVK